MRCKGGLFEEQILRESTGARFTGDHHELVAEQQRTLIKTTRRDDTDYQVELALLNLVARLLSAAPGRLI